MNTLSKVFVVVNLVFATIFAAFTLTLYSKRVDWRDKFETKSEEMAKVVDAKNIAIDQLKKEKDTLAGSLRSAEQAKRELYETNADLDQQVKTTAVKAYEADQERRLLSERMEASQLELGRRHTQIEQMHKIVLTQQTALRIAKDNMRNALNEKMEMENEANNARHQLVASQKEKGRLEKDLHHNSWVIQKLMDAGVPVRDLVFGTEQQPQVEIHGKVLAVRPEVNLVMVSVGTEDQVRKGYRFTVYRDDRYIGKVQVEKVFNDMCSARILSDWTKEKIQEGDDVATGIGG